MDGRPTASVPAILGTAAASLAAGAIARQCCRGGVSSSQPASWVAASSEKDDMIDDVKHSRRLARQVLKRAKFCVFSKTAPDSLPAFDVDKDFAYHYF
eukprot:COSAG06_NODE_31729_length_516_cov_1.786571_1_plen_97_part_01